MHLHRCTANMARNIAPATVRLVLALRAACLACLGMPLVSYRPLAEQSQFGLRSTKAGEFKTRLKINHWRSSPGPPELAGFYVDSVWVAGARA